MLSSAAVVFGLKICNMNLQTNILQAYWEDTSVCVCITGQ